MHTCHSYASRTGRDVKHMDWSRGIPNLLKSKLGYPESVLCPWAGFRAGPLMMNVLQRFHLRQGKDKEPKLGHQSKHMIADSPAMPTTRIIAARSYGTLYFFRLDCRHSLTSEFRTPWSLPVEPAGVTPDHPVIIKFASDQTLDIYHSFQLYGIWIPAWWQPRSISLTIVDASGDNQSTTACHWL